MQQPHMLSPVSAIKPKYPCNQHVTPTLPQTVKIYHPQTGRPGRGFPQTKTADQSPYYRWMILFYANFFLHLLKTMSL